MHRPHSARGLHSRLFRGSVRGRPPAPDTPPRQPRWRAAGAALTPSVSTGTGRRTIRFRSPRRKCTPDAGPDGVQDFAARLRGEPGRLVEERQPGSPGVRAPARAVRRRSTRAAVNRFKEGALTSGISRPREPPVGAQHRAERPAEDRMNRGARGRAPPASAAGLQNRPALSDYRGTPRSGEAGPRDRRPARRPRTPAGPGLCRRCRPWSGTTGQHPTPPGRVPNVMLFVLSVSLPGAQADSAPPSLHQMCHEPPVRRLSAWHTVGLMDDDRGTHTDTAG